MCVRGHAMCFHYVDFIVLVLCELFARIGLFSDIEVDRFLTFAG